MGHRTSGVGALGDSCLANANVLLLLVRADEMCLLVVVGVETQGTHEGTQTQHPPLTGGEQTRKKG